MHELSKKPVLYICIQRLGLWNLLHGYRSYCISVWRRRGARTLIRLIWNELFGYDDVVSHTQFYRQPPQQRVNLQKQITHRLVARLLIYHSVILSTRCDMLPLYKVTLQHLSLPAPCCDSSTPLSANTIIMWREQRQDSCRATLHTLCLIEPSPRTPQNHHCMQFNTRHNEMLLSTNPAKSRLTF